MVIALTTAADGIDHLPILETSPAANARKANTGLFVRSSASSVRPGILPASGTWQLSYGTPTADQWYLTAGSAVLSDGAGGALVVTSGSTKSEAVTRPGAGTSRYDVIALEPVYTGSPAVSVVRYAGTAAASPVLSTATSQVTANGLILGSYLLANTGAPTVTMAPQRTSPNGGPVRVANAADLATLAPVSGDLAYQEDVNLQLVRVGSGWKSPLGVGILADLKPTGTINTTVGTANIWINESTPMTATFNAPPSGAIKVSIGAYVFQSATAVAQKWGFKISGGTVRDPLDTEVLRVFNGAAGGIAVGCGRSYTITGLTAGTSYTLTSAVNMTGTGSASAQDRNLFVEAL